MTKSATLQSTDEAIHEYLQSRQALVQDEIIEADKVKKENPKLHYNSDQSDYLQSTFQQLWYVSTGLHYAPDQTLHGQRVEQQVYNHS